MVGDIHELVEFQTVRLLSTVVEISDVVVVLVEYSKSVPILIGGSVFSVVFLFPVLIKIIDLRLDSNLFNLGGILFSCVKHINCSSQKGSNS